MGEILAMKHLGFLGGGESNVSNIDNARREFECFFAEIVDVKNFPALMDLFPAARELTNDELLATARHARTTEGGTTLA